MAEGGVELHCQIVLCRGINDGAELDRTMRDLAALYPAVSSVSVVPAGLTRHREGLYPLPPFTKEECAAVLDQVEAFGAACLEKHGSRLFFPSDELYLAAGRELPGEEFYEGYPQIENGVGMLTSLYTEFISWQNETKGKKLLFPRTVSIATGVSAYPMMCRIARSLERAFPRLSVNVYEIKNRFFGESITVAGLLTATDIIDQLKGKELGRALILPADVLRSEGDLFLDDKTPKDVERALGTSLRFAENDGAALAAAILRR
jgi:putative radical SAM enzyme (TIGR03279 family)